MRVPVKLLGFVFWLFFFNCVQCQAKQKLCSDLSVDHGFTYWLPSNQEEIFYSCNEGYKPFNGNWWDSVTCREGSWSEEPRCIREEECGALPSVHHGKLTLHDQGTAEVECDPGFKSTPRFIKCVSGTWETSVCEVGVRCNIPPKVENALITSKPEEFYVDGSSVTYACRRSISINGKSTVFCRNGIWEELPTCKEVMCVTNLPANMRSDRHPGPVVSIRPGDTITLSCVGRGSELQGQSKITCRPNGEWDVQQFPKCVGGKCGPPPKVEFADTIEMQKPQYNSGERVEYGCFNKFTLVQHHRDSKYYTCEQGVWKGDIKCLKPCTVTVEEMDERGIQLYYGGRQKIFLPHEDRITFACQWGKQHLKVNALIQYCNDGVMILPECV